MALAPWTQSEKVGAGVGGLVGLGVLGYGFWPFALGASVGYWIGRTLNPSPSVPAPKETKP